MADSLPQIVIGSCLSLSEQGLELGEGFFDWVEIGRISRQEEHPGPPVPYRLTRPWAFVDVEIVPDHHIAGFELWCQLSGHISVKSFAIDGPLNHPRRDQFMTAQSGDKGLGIPFAEGGICKEPLALDATSPQRGHIGFNRGLVDEHEPSGFCPDRGQAMLVPFIALSPDISAFFLRCQKCFFYM